MTDDYTEAPAWALALISGWYLPDGYSLHWSGHKYERALHLIKNGSSMLGGIRYQEEDDQWCFWREEPPCYGQEPSPEAALVNMAELFNLPAWLKEAREG